MYLDREQEQGLSGELGPTYRWALEVLVELGRRTGAQRLVPVASVHVPSWCGGGDREAWDALRSIAGTSPLPITANPGHADHFDAGHRELLEGLQPHGAYTFSCAPYLCGNHPNRGDIIAWGGRAALAFANSVLGLRGERETFETAVSSAITRLTPERGILIEAARRPTIAVVLPASRNVDYQLLGWTISRRLGEGVPLLCGARPTFDEAKRLAFAINSRETVPLFSMQRDPVPPSGMERIEISPNDLRTDTGPAPDLVIMGCPHLSEQDINRWSKKLEGRPRTPTEAWFFTSRLCRDKCPVFGAVLRSRGKMFVDTCPLSMREELAGRTVACDSPELADCLSKNSITAFYASQNDLLTYLTTRSEH